MLPNVSVVTEASNPDNVPLPVDVQTQNDLLSDVRVIQAIPLSFYKPCMCETMFGHSFKPYLIRHNLFQYIGN